MKLVNISLVLLLLLIQYSAWFGKGGFFERKATREELEIQVKKNKTLTDRNLQIKAEVLDLKSGYDEIEESARSELGMIKEGEIFFKTPD